MARHLAVLLSEAQARALYAAAADSATLHTTQGQDEADRWDRHEGRVLTRALDAITRAATAEGIRL